MLVVGIDVAAEVHQVAVIDETESVVVKPTPFAEDAAGYQKLFELLARAGARGGGDLPLAPASAQPERTLVVMEATGHYWQNLFAALMAEGYAVAWSTRCAPIALPAKSWRGPRPIASTACRSPALARRNARLRPACRRRRPRNCVSWCGCGRG
jgi:hypothetical protein